MYEASAVEHQTAGVHYRYFSMYVPRAIRKSARHGDVTAYCTTHPVGVVLSSVFGTMSCKYLPSSKKPIGLVTSSEHYRRVGSERRSDAVGVDVRVFILHCVPRPITCRSFNAALHEPLVRSLPDHRNWHSTRDSENGTHDR